MQGADHEKIGIRAIHDKRLFAAKDERIAFGRCPGGDPLGPVLAALVDRQGHDERPLGDRTEPLLLLLGVAGAANGDRAEHGGRQKRGEGQTPARLARNQPRADEPEVHAAMRLRHENAGQAGLDHRLPEIGVVVRTVTAAADGAQGIHAGLVGE